MNHHNQQQQQQQPPPQQQSHHHQHPQQQHQQQHQNHNQHHHSSHHQHQNHQQNSSQPSQHQQQQQQHHHHHHHHQQQHQNAARQGQMTQANSSSGLFSQQHQNGDQPSQTSHSHQSSKASKDLPANGKKTKGRVRIKMEFIHNKLRRYTTFSKRKTGIMKKAFELATLTGTQVMLLVASETGHVYTFATRKLQPMIISDAGKALIQTCLNSPDSDNLLMSAAQANQNGQPSAQNQSQSNSNNGASQSSQVSQPALLSQQQMQHLQQQQQHQQHQQQQQQQQLHQSNQDNSSQSPSAASQLAGQTLSSNGPQGPSPHSTSNSSSSTSSNSSSSSSSSSASSPHSHLLVASTNSTGSARNGADQTNPMRLLYGQPGKPAVGKQQISSSAATTTSATSTPSSAAASSSSSSTTTSSTSSSSSSSVATAAAAAATTTTAATTATTTTTTDQRMSATGFEETELSYSAGLNEDPNDRMSMICQNSILATTFTSAPCQQAQGLLLDDPKSLVQQSRPIKTFNDCLPISMGTIGSQNVANSGNGSSSVITSPQAFEQTLQNQEANETDDRTNTQQHQQDRRSNQQQVRQQQQTSLGCNQQRNHQHQASNHRGTRLSYNTNGNKMVEQQQQPQQQHSLISIPANDSPQFNYNLLYTGLQSFNANGSSSDANDNQHSHHLINEDDEDDVLNDIYHYSDSTDSQPCSKQANLDSAFVQSQSHHQQPDSANSQQFRQSSGDYLLNPRKSNLQIAISNSNGRFNNLNLCRVQQQQQQQNAFQQSGNVGGYSDGSMCRQQRRKLHDAAIGQDQNNNNRNRRYLLGHQASNTDLQVPNQDNHFATNQTNQSMSFHQHQFATNAGQSVTSVANQIDLSEECSGLFVEYQTSRNSLGGMEELHSLNVTNCDSETLEEQINMLSGDDCFATGDDLQDFGMSSTNDHFLNMLSIDSNNGQLVTSNQDSGTQLNQFSLEPSNSYNQIELNSSLATSLAGESIDELDATDVEASQIDRKSSRVVGNKKSNQKGSSEATSCSSSSNGSKNNSNNNNTAQSKITTTNTNKRLLPKKTGPSRTNSAKKSTSTSWRLVSPSPNSNNSSSSALSPSNSCPSYHQEVSYRQQLDNLRKKLKMDILPSEIDKGTKCETGPAVSVPLYQPQVTSLMQSMASTTTTFVMSNGQTSNKIDCPTAYVIAPHNFDSSNGTIYLRTSSGGLVPISNQEASSLAVGRRAIQPILASLTASDNSDYSSSSSSVSSATSNNTLLSNCIERPQQNLGPTTLTGTSSDRTATSTSSAMSSAIFEQITNDEQNNLVVNHLHQRTTDQSSSVGGLLVSNGQANNANGDEQLIKTNGVILSSTPNVNHHHRAHGVDLVFESSVTTNTASITTSSGDMLHQVGKDVQNGTNRATEQQQVAVVALIN